MINDKKTCWKVSCVLVLLSVGALGCRDSDVLYAVKEIQRFRLDAQKQAQILPYRQAQQEAFRLYFSEVVAQAALIKSEDWRINYLNGWVADDSLPQLCAQIMMPKAIWQKIVTGCTRNRFFLCVDEIKAYQEAVLALRAKLQPEQRKRFDQTPACRVAL